MAKNLISSILKKMNMQRLSHARSESDLHVMANAQKVSATLLLFDLRLHPSTPPQPHTIPPSCKYPPTPS